MTEIAEPMLEAQHAGSSEPPAAPRELAPPPQRLPLEFTGSGGEYFRIWVVNLLFTLLTLGIYSAWAKVRKTRYFWSNTRLDGAAFQYHGNPVAILRGRILVGIVFLAYSLLGRISIAAGIVAAVVLGLGGPWIFYKAMRFKLSNTSWRGVRFGFETTIRATYVALAPAVILWVAFTGVAAMLRPGERPDDLGMLPLLLSVYLVGFALTPWLHARFKRYQHGATTCGSQKFELEPSTGAFYGLYGKTALVALVPFAALAITMGVGVFTMRGQPPGSKETIVAAIAVAYAVLLVVGLLPLSYFTAGAQRLVWTRTHGGPIRFSTSVTTRGLMGIWFKNGFLTIVTLGLYWPLAAVNVARYQLQCMTVEAAAPLESIAAGAQAIEASATGDGAIDFFGWDVGL